MEILLSILLLTVGFVFLIKGANELAVSNVVGSNIFNLLVVLGASALISPITVGMEAVIDTVFAIFITVIGVIFSATKLKFERWEGGVFVGTYVVYLVYMILRAYGMI